MLKRVVKIFIRSCCIELISRESAKWVQNCKISETKKLHKKFEWSHRRELKSKLILRKSRLLATFNLFSATLNELHILYQLCESFLFEFAILWPVINPVRITKKYHSNALDYVMREIENCLCGGLLVSSVAMFSFIWPSPRRECNRITFTSVGRFCLNDTKKRANLCTDCR